MLAVFSTLTKFKADILGNAGEKLYKRDRV